MGSGTMDLQVATQLTSAILAPSVGHAHGLARKRRQDEDQVEELPVSSRAGSGPARIVDSRASIGCGQAVITELRSRRSDFDWLEGHPALRAGPGLVGSHLGMHWTGVLACSVCRRK